MNRKKKQNTLSLGMILVLVTAGMILSAGGVSYVLVKNQQVRTQREIAASQARIHDHEVAITTHRADIEEALGVFRLQARLKAENSKLVDIPPGLVEICHRSEPPPDRALARAD